MSRKEIFGITVDDISQAAVFDRMTAWHDEGRAAHIIVTPNVDHFQRIVQGGDKESAHHGLTVPELYHGADLCLNDSRVMKLFARRFLGVELEHVVPGSDLTREFLDSSLARQGRVLVVGLEQEFFQVLAGHYPDLQLTHYSPPMGFVYRQDEVERLVAFAVAEDYRFIILAVGSPRQEIVAIKIRQDGRSRATMFCVGASLDFLVGKERRAPRLVQRLSLEWLWRALSSPRRLVPRYYKSFQFLLSLIKRTRAGA